MNRLPIVSLLLVVLCAFVGCQPAGSNLDAPSPVDRIQAMNLFVAGLAAVNMDDEPGPDGVVAEVLFYEPSRPGTVLVSGTLEFRMYEGQIPAERLDDVQPLRTWSYAGSELEPFVFRKMGLWGYRVPLTWGASEPTTPTVTLTARYRPQRGRAVSAAPTGISVGG
jgi:hypothetical protein